MKRTRKRNNLSRLPKSVRRLQCGAWRRDSASTRKSESGCLGVRLPIHPVLRPLAAQPHPTGRTRAEGKARVEVVGETTTGTTTRKREILRQHHQSRDNSMTQGMLLGRTQTMYRERIISLPVNGQVVANSSPHASRIVILEGLMPMAVAASGPEAQKQLRIHGKGSSWSNGLFYFLQLSREHIPTYNPAHIAKRPTRPEIHRQSYAGRTSRQSSSRVDCICNLRSIGTVLYNKVSARMPDFVDQETYEHNAHSCPNTAHLCWSSFEHAHSIQSR